MNDTLLTCGSVTFWGGGFDHSDASDPTATPERVGAVTGSLGRLDRLGEVIAQQTTDGYGPRILLWQQGNMFDADGGALLHRVEQLLAPYGRYRGYLTRSDWNMTHDVIFLREACGTEPDLWVTHHWWDYTDPADRALIGWMRVKVGDSNSTLLLRSVLLYPWSAARRVEQAEHIAGAARALLAANAGATLLVGGSFNSADSHPSNPVRDWGTAARLDAEGARHKGRLKADGSGEYEADTTTMDVLLGRWSTAAARRLGGAGWVSLSAADGNWEPTVERHTDKGGPLKINDFLSNRPIVVAGTSRTHRALAAGKHRYITITIRV